MSLHDVLAEVAAERDRQLAKHGDQNHLPDGTGPDEGFGPLHRDAPPEFGSFADYAEWAKARCKAASQNEGGNGSVTFEHILTEEYFEALSESEPGKLRAELFQVAATAVQWIQAIDSRTAAISPAQKVDPSLGLPERAFSWRQRLRWIWQGLTSEPTLPQSSAQDTAAAAAQIMQRGSDRHQRVLAAEKSDPVLRYLRTLEGMEPDEVLTHRIDKARRQRHQELVAEAGLS